MNGGAETGRKAAEAVIAALSGKKAARSAAFREALAS
jgi:hypothetical protein